VPPSRLATGGQSTACRGEFKGKWKALAACMKIPTLSSASGHREQVQVLKQAGLRIDRCYYPLVNRASPPGTALQKL
jgi:hypothetical protein